MDRRPQKCTDAFLHSCFNFILILFIFADPFSQAYAMDEKPDPSEAALLASTEDGGIPVEVDRLLGAFAKDLGKFRDLMGPKLSPALKTQFQKRLQEVSQRKSMGNFEYQIYPGGQITIDLKDNRMDWMHLVEGKSGWVQAYFSIAGNGNPFDGCHYLVQKSRPQSATIECKQVFPKARGGVIWAAASTHLDWMF